MAGGGKRNPGYIVEYRLQAVENLILEGRGTIREIWPYVKEWGISRERVKRYIYQAQARLMKGLEEDRKAVIAKHIRSRYKERARIKRKGMVPMVDDDGNPIHEEDGRPKLRDAIDDRMLLAIDQDIAKLEGAYEYTLNIKGGLNNRTAHVDIELTSEEGKRIADELGLLFDSEGEKSEEL